MTPPFVDKTIYSHCLRALKGWILNIPTLVEVIDGNICKNPVPMVRGHGLQSRFSNQSTNPWAVFVGKTMKNPWIRDFLLHQFLTSPSSSDQNPKIQWLVGWESHLFLAEKKKRVGEVSSFSRSPVPFFWHRNRRIPKNSRFTLLQIPKEFPKNGSCSSPQVKSIVFHGSFGSTPATRLWQDSPQF